MRTREHHAMQAPRLVKIPVSPGLSLEGRLIEAGPRAALVAPPHPLYGGSIGNPVVRTLEAALASRGFTTLAFNYRGIGESDGEPSGDNEHGRQDYRAALAFLGAREVTWLCGYSFGGVLALSIAQERPSAHCLAVAPPVAMTDPAWLTRPNTRTIVLAGDSDPYAPEAELREWEKCEGLELSILEDEEHFFLGSGVENLARALTSLAL